jgi:hypothetical protein
MAFPTRSTSCMTGTMGDADRTTTEGSRRQRLHLQIRPFCPCAYRLRYGVGLRTMAGRTASYTYMAELSSGSSAVHYGASMTRRMADAAFLSSQQAGAHSEPHMAPINAFVDKIRDKDGRGWVPYIAPHHGGTDAQILSILRDPGPAAHSDKGSGFLSVENDDPTAERQARLFETHGISPRIVLPWNAYP